MQLNTFLDSILEVNVVRLSGSLLDNFSLILTVKKKSNGTDRHLIHIFLHKQGFKCRISTC